MSVHKFSRKNFDAHIKVNWEEHQLEWEPENLKDNIFELVGIARQLYSIRMVGDPFEIKEGTYAWKFEDKFNTH